MNLAPLRLIIPHLCGVTRHRYGSRRLFMIKVVAFFDDSSDSNKTILVVAGWVASAKTWDRFNDDWHKALMKPKKIDYFSHHEAMRSEDQFDGFTTKQTERKIKSLIRVVSNYRKEIYGLFGGMDLIQYKSLFSGSRVHRKVLRAEMGNVHHYQWCVNGAVANVLRKELERGNRTDPVDFVFDQQTKLLAACALEFKEYFKLRLPDHVQAIAGIITEGDDKHVLPLQAADLLAGRALMAARTKGMQRFKNEMSQCNLDFTPFDCMPPNAERLIPELVEDVNQLRRR